MIFLNLETTGLDPVKYGILSIGAVDTERTKNYHFYDEPRLEKGKEIDPYELKNKGFVEHKARDPSKRRLRDVLKRFMIWTRDCKVVTLAGQNPARLAPFLKESIEKYGMEWVFGDKYVDLYTTAVNSYNREGIKIPMKKRRYDLDFDAILWSVGLERSVGIHSSLEDAFLEAEAYFRLEIGSRKFKNFGPFEEIRNFKDYKLKSIR